MESHKVDDQGMAQQLPTLGVDFGRVINDAASHASGDDTTFLTGGLHEAMQTPAMAGVIPALARFSELFGGRIWVISKCGPRIQERTEQWLAYHEFFERTGIDESQIRFCRARSEKADQCEQLAVTHFVDDRADVLRYLVGIVDHLYLFGARSGEAPTFALPVKDWSEAEALIQSALGRPRR